MTIREGYNRKKTHIRVSATPGGRVELWIEQTGQERGGETLSYMTANELLELRNEIEAAARSLFGIDDD